jgi:DNA-binding response OmpR family regulator/DNA-binding CsgD family transcriptional regulator
LLFDALEAAQHRPLVATSGELALQRLEKIQPDLILLDMRMPGMDGLTTCANIRRHSAGRDVPIIFMTAVEEPEQKVSAFAAGAVDYVTKPFHTAEVLARIDTHLRLRALQRQLAQEVVWRTELEHRLEGSLEQALVACRRDGRIVFATQRAAHLLAHGFTSAAVDGVLPPELQSLLAQGRNAQHRFTKAGGTLSVRLLVDDDADGLAMFWIEEKRAEGDYAALRALGMSSREAEVLYWMSHGKTNPEIGIIIGAAAGTVKKHAENIFAKLHVEGRSAAMLRALEVLPPG